MLSFVGELVDKVMRLKAAEKSVLEWLKNQLSLMFLRISSTVSLYLESVAIFFATC